MRVLYIACGNGLNPGIGGSLGRTLEVMRRLAATCDVSFLTTRGGDVAARRFGLNVSTQVLPASLGRQDERSLADRALAYVVSTLASLPLMARIPLPDVVFTDSDYFCDTVPAALLARRGARWVAMSHHRMTVGAAGLNRWLTSVSGTQQTASLRLIARQASLAFVYDTDMGRNVARELNRAGLPPERISGVSNGVSQADVDAAERLAVPAQYDACYVAGLRPNKGLYDIVPIWDRVRAHVPGATLALIGGAIPEYHEWLVRTIAATGLTEHIQVLGARTHTAALTAIASSRIYIAPSHEEGWGTALCEAMALGRPCIAYDLPTYRAPFHGGYAAVPCFDTTAFADGVAQLLCDDALAAQLGGVARHVGRRYEWSAVSARDHAEFVHLLDPSAGAASWPRPLMEG